MSAEPNAEREMVYGMLRGSGLDFEGSIDALRVAFDAMLMAAPLPEHVEYSNSTIAGVPVLEARSAATEDRVLVYLHGGAFVSGSTRGYAGFFGSLAHAAGARGISVEYRLAPEHPYPAGIDDAVAVISAVIDEVGASHVALAGDSAGGALVTAALVRLRDEGSDLPACAAVFSPWVDLTLESDSIVENADADPSLTEGGLRAAAAHYLDGLDPEDEGASPLFADLSDLPPVLIQVGSIEILLNDSLELAAALATDGVQVDLQVRPGMPHVYASFAGLLPEGDQAVADFGRFVIEHTA